MIEVGGFWRWSCQDGHGGAYDSPVESDDAAAAHMRVCSARPVRMHTGASPGAWEGQARFG